MDFLDTDSKDFPKPGRKLRDVTNTRASKSRLKDKENKPLVKAMTISTTKEDMTEKENKEPILVKEAPQEEETDFKKGLLSDMCFQIACGKRLDVISEEIVRNDDAEKALVFMKYSKRLQTIEREILGKRSYEDLEKGTQEFEDDEDEEEFKKIVKVSKEKGKEVSKEKREEYKLRKSLPYYRCAEYFVDNIQSLSLFQQELAAFKSFAGPNREIIIDQAMKQGLNSIYYIYLFKRKEKTMKEIQTAKKKSNKNFDLWDLIIEYISSFPKEK